MPCPLCVVPPKIQIIIYTFCQCSEKIDSRQNTHAIPPYLKWGKTAVEVKKMIGGFYGNGLVGSTKYSI